MSRKVREGLPALCSSRDVNHTRNEKASGPHEANLGRALAGNYSSKSSNMLEGMSRGPLGVGETLFPLMCRDKEETRNFCISVENNLRIDLTLLELALDIDNIIPLLAGNPVTSRFLE